MKKITCLLLIICMLVTITSCGITILKDISVMGLENYSSVNSTISTVKYLIPEGFIDMFPYTNGNYYYEDRWFSAGMERALMWIRYDASTYENAKRYCYENMDFEKEPKGELEGFTLHESLAGGSTPTPWKLGVFAYNDETHTLLFLAMVVPTKIVNDPSDVYNDFAGYIKMVYDKDFMKDAEPIPF